MTEDRELLQRMINLAEGIRQLPITPESQRVRALALAVIEHLTDTGVFPPSGVWSLGAKQ